MIVAGKVMLVKSNGVVLSNVKSKCDSIVDGNG